MAGFTYNGKRYELPESFTFGEARVFKELGIKIAEMEADAGDPDMALALVVIAMRRAGEQVSVAEVEQMSMTDLVFDDDAGAAAEVEELPPSDTVGRADAQAASGAGNSETTLASSGSPVSRIA